MTPETRRWYEERRSHLVADLDDQESIKSVDRRLKSVLWAEKQRREDEKIKMRTRSFDEEDWKEKEKDAVLPSERAIQELIAFQEERRIRKLARQRMADELKEKEAALRRAASVEIEKMFGGMDEDTGLFEGSAASNGRFGVEYGRSSVASVRGEEYTYAMWGEYSEARIYKNDEVYSSVPGKVYQLHRARHSHIPHSGRISSNYRSYSPQVQ
ncbi:hypothetical protein HK104_007588 [Borealophlyctis nickersoniae]|nr:hypothetical protein HK104_007588 [Borealophlyctis nickersoniae]